MTESRDIKLSRRGAIAGLFAAPALSLPSVVQATETVAPRASFSCVATPQAVEGPYYFDAKMQRSDITEGHPGAPLRVRFIAMDAASCQPLAGARVDIWHTRADGLYSGYGGQGDDHAIDTSGGTFMRGTQMTDAHGEARFLTVYPAWYEGRTTHVHFKVFTDKKNVLTGQMYFPDALSQYIYANVDAYSRKTARDTFNADDGLARMDQTHGGFCDVSEQADHYLATLVLGVDRSATMLTHDMGPPEFGGPPGGRPPWGAGPPPGMRPRHPRIAAIVPGVKPSEQKNG
jgi:protocatechuate 3,4-dioxygenase beta subunit